MLRRWRWSLLWPWQGQQMQSENLFVCIAFSDASCTWGGFGQGHQDQLLGQNPPSDQQWNHLSLDQVIAPCCHVLQVWDWVDQEGVQDVASQDPSSLHAPSS